MNTSLQNTHLQSIKLFSFRNLIDSEIFFHPLVNFISGDNGEGKSNLVEAIHVLSATKTFRSVHQRDLTRWDTGEFSVFGDVSLEAGESNTSLGVSFDGRTKNVFLNGDVTREVSHYLNIFPTVTFVPRDVDIVYGSPSVRRKFLDRYCSLLSPHTLSAMTAFKKVIRTKNSLLKEYPVDTRQIQTLNHLVADHSIRITCAREEFLEMARSYFTEYYSQFAGKGGEIQIEMTESFMENGAKKRTIEEYERVLEECLGRERERRVSVIGPHYDDLNISIFHRSARQFASQGQARSIVLSLLLSVVKVIEKQLGVLPALLLDDFSSELDRGRMQRFFDLLRHNSHQVFITGTDLSSSQLGVSESIHYTVKKGEVLQEK